MRKTKRKGILSNTISEYINTNAKTYIIVTIMFLIGLVIAIISVNNSDNVHQEQIKLYINNFITGVKENNEISKAEVLKESIKNNFYITLILWFLGSTIIGMPLIFIVVTYKGYSIGYAISSIIATLGPGKGTVFIITTLLVQYIIYIPCVLSLAVSGIKLYKLIVEDRRRENIKFQIIRHTIICLLIFVTLCIASLISVNLGTSFTGIIAKYL